MTKLAIVTMSYNEPDYLPVWVKYYAQHVPEEHIYIIDHGSDDGSTEDLGRVNIVQIPRSPKDNDKRTKAVSDFCNFLLKWYDVVIHADCDEIIVPDPEKYRNLLHFCEATEQKVVTAIGLDVYQVSDDEAPFDPSKPVTEQRHYVRFSSSMCKPVLIRRPIQWAAGFHSCDAKVEFGDLLLFHLRYFDRKIGMKRLAHTRSMAWSSATAGSHQRMPDEDYVNMVNGASNLPKVEGLSLRATEEPLKPYIDAVLASEQDLPPPRYRIDLHIFGNQQWKIPDRFRGLF